VKKIKEIQVQNEKWQKELDNPPELEDVEAINSEIVRALFDGQGDLSLTVILRGRSTGSRAKLDHAWKSCKSDKGPMLMPPPSRRRKSVVRLTSEMPQMLPFAMGITHSLQDEKP